MRFAARFDSSLSTASGQAWRQGLSPALSHLTCAPDGTGTLTNPAGALLQRFATPLEALAWLGASHKALPPQQRWVGFLSYDLGRWFESLPSGAVDDLALPLFAFSLHRLQPQMPLRPVADPPPATLLGSSLSRERYLATIAQAVEYIAAGDIFQVNLAQRFAVSTPIRPADLYARIQQLHPAHYAAFLDLGRFALVCNSPELFLATTSTPAGTRIVTRPIKGTRPRLPGMDQQLRNSIKDQAELHMIVDLERNDLGRICQIGSVRVTEPRTIETHPTVYHGASTVEGLLRPEVGLVEILRATFPGGSITGAPKIRAMEIIEEMEPVRRGPYCGAIGYLDADGTMQFNIAIRTLICLPETKTVYIPVGGGIVADSTPENEYDETLTKARAAFSALGLE